MKILGIHDGHNATACILIDGKIIACIQEERLNRNKNWLGFPEKSIQECLRIAKIGIEDIDYVALGSKYMISREEFLKEKFPENLKRPSRFIHVLRYTHTYDIIKSVFYKYLKLRGKDKIKDRKRRIARYLGISEDKIILVDHHLAHASASY
ncbi:hypothetical protein DRN58_08530, partial [Thermococci archaeon]